MDFWLTTKKIVFEYRAIHAVNASFCMHTLLFQPETLLPSQLEVPLQFKQDVKEIPHEFQQINRWHFSIAFVISSNSIHWIVRCKCALGELIWSPIFLFGLILNKNFFFCFDKELQIFNNLLRMQNEMITLSLFLSK